MKVLDTALGDVKLLKPDLYHDDRGSFFEAWNCRTFSNLGIDVAFVQDNQSRSKKGVLRGLHYQVVRPQGKLVRVVAGAVFDVVVDIRPDSAHFGEWAGFELSASNGHILWVPPGFAHGFLSLEDDTDFVYKCTDYYSPEHERTILWCDPTLAIDWRITDGRLPLLNPKDAAGATLAQADL